RDARTRGRARAACDATARVRSMPRSSRWVERAGSRLSPRIERARRPEVARDVITAAPPGCQEYRERLGGLQQLVRGLLSRTAALGTRPCPRASPRGHGALGHHPVLDLLPRPVEHAVVVGRGQHDLALGVVRRPRAGTLVIAELPGQPGFALAQLLVRALGLASLVRRARHQLAEIELLDHAVEPAVLPVLLELDHAEVVPLAPRAVLAVGVVVAFDDDLAAWRELLIDALHLAVDERLLGRDPVVRVIR